MRRSIYRIVNNLQRCFSNTIDKVRFRISIEISSKYNAEMTAGESFPISTGGSKVKTRINRFSTAFILVESFKSIPSTRSRITSKKSLFGSVDESSDCVMCANMEMHAFTLRGYPSINHSLVRILPHNGMKEIPYQVPSLDAEHIEGKEKREISHFLEPARLLLDFWKILIC